jgi:hypothetical protein
MTEPKPEDHVTLIVDGDTIAYMAAAAVQKTQESFDGFVMPFAKAEEGEACVDNMLIGLFRDLGATGMQVYLSDPEGSWREEYAGSYKGNRKVGGLTEGRDMTVRPLLLGRLKEYLRVKYEATHWSALEADDVVGILLTTPDLFPGKIIAVGRDKDFDTIPGLHHQIGRDLDSKGKPKVREVSQDYADYFHLCQGFAGDRIDGYPGCPTIGMERAKKILAEPYELIPDQGVVTRGSRKGQTTTKYVKKYGCSPWRCIVSHFEKEGLTEEDALRNARLARILRYEDYNKETGAIRLWVPK